MRNIVKKWKSGIYIYHEHTYLLIFFFFKNLRNFEKFVFFPERVAFERVFQLASQALAEQRSDWTVRSYLQKKSMPFPPGAGFLRRSNQIQCFQMGVRWSMWFSNIWFPWFLSRYLLFLKEFQSSVWMRSDGSSQRRLHCSLQTTICVRQGSWNFVFESEKRLLSITDDM